MPWKSKKQSSKSYQNKESRRLKKYVMIMMKKLEN